jgi:diguanylate cyclase (GGDEF)-like protein
MTDTLRSSDWVVRAGGEEFVVVLPETDLAGASIVADKLRAEIAAHPVTSGTLGVPITISVGYSAVATDEELERFSFDELLRTADLRLYEAKVEGRNRCKGSGVVRSGAQPEDTAPKLRLQGAMGRAAKLSLLEP